jgi:hypothetical protein
MDGLRKTTNLGLPEYESFTTGLIYFRNMDSIGHNVLHICLLHGVKLDLCKIFIETIDFLI